METKTPNVISLSSPVVDGPDGNHTIPKSGVGLHSNSTQGLSSATLLAWPPKRIYTTAYDAKRADLTFTNIPIAQAHGDGG